MARLMTIRIDAELLQQLITVGELSPSRCVEGLPKGAELVSSFFDTHTNLAMLVFQHESFGYVESGGAIPRLGVTHKRVKWEEYVVEV